MTKRATIFFPLFMMLFTLSAFAQMDQDQNFYRPFPEAESSDVKIFDSSEEVRQKREIIPVCVRTCDGFFFPLSTGDLKESVTLEEFCSASCPNSATELYFMPLGGDPEEAFNAAGDAYAHLPNAFIYQKILTPSCSCRAANESWRRALEYAEQLLRKESGDVVVFGDEYYDGTADHK